VDPRDWPAKIQEDREQEEQKIVDLILANPVTVYARFMDEVEGWTEVGTVKLDRIFLYSLRNFLWRSRRRIRPFSDLYANTG
jgi:hypothetical protein